MKKITQYIKLLSLALVTTATVTSCEGFLDTESSDSVPTNSAIESFADAKIMLNGVYDGLQGNSNNYSYYGANMIFIGDVMGDFMQANQIGKRTSSAYEMQFTESSSPAPWASPYNVIRRANNLLMQIEAGKADDAKPEDVNHIKGQALAIRALCHFDLLRLYSRSYTPSDQANSGIPVVLEPSDAMDVPARNTINEVYTAVIKDLNEAYTLMNGTASTGYLNKWGAKALLSRVLLQKGDNAGALAAAEDVIDNGGYKLWTNAEYSSMWVEGGNSELIFEIVNFDSSDWTDRNGLSNLINEAGYADFLLSKKAVQYFAANPRDVRGSMFVASSEPAEIKTYGAAKVWCTKYPGRDGNADFRINNIYVLRLSEIYLNAAEAAARMGDGAKAATFFNATYKRSGAAAVATATLDMVLQEKGIEFIGEGQRFFDMMRNGKTLDRTDRYEYQSLRAESTKFTNAYYRTIFPISFSQMNVNKNLVQNPGY